MAGMSQAKARITAVLLRAALGTCETELATIGALTYALRLREHMSDHK